MQIPEKDQISEKDQETFNLWLSDYQKDFVKIVGKFRRPNHPLSSDEIISEINLTLIKKREKLINQEESIIADQVTFKKVSYAYAKNYIVWTAGGATNKDKKYLKKRSDGVITTDEGEKTLFEYVCETIGSEDEGFRKLEDSDKFQNILKWIFDYSHFLTSHQKNVLELVLTGKTLQEIGQLLGVTHQAVSALSIEVFRRIQNHIKVDLSDGNSDKRVITKGHAAINKLFGKGRQARKLDPKAMKKIKSLIFKEPKTYTLEDLSNQVGGVISPKQISAFINSSKLHKLIKRKCKSKTPRA